MYTVVAAEAVKQVSGRPRAPVLDRVSPEGDALHVGEHHVGETAGPSQTPRECRQTLDLQPQTPNVFHKEGVRASHRRDLKAKGLGGRVPEVRRAALHLT